MKTNQRSHRIMKLLATAIILGGILAAPVLAETGTTNVISGVNTNAGATFIVGDSGPFNYFEINSAGSVSNGVGIIGNQVGASNNTVLVTGGSVWTNVSTLTIGQAGSVNQLIISNSVVVLDTASTIGATTGANSNTVTVTGIGSVWTNTSTITVGRPGSFNSLIVANGGGVFSANGTASVGVNGIGGLIGHDGGSGNNVTVTGSGSKWINNGELFLGNGNSTTLTIANSGTVVNTAGTIGYAGTGHSVLVTGQGSTWTNTGDLTVGLSGTFGSLTISNAGAVTATRVVIGSSDNKIVVTGSNSLLTSTGVYADIGATRGQLIITNGGRADLLAGMRVSDGAGSGNKVIVTDPGSVLNLAGIGFLMGVSSGGNQIIITNGGFMSVVVGGDANTGNSTDFNELIVTGAGSTLTNNSGFRVGNVGKSNTFTVSQGGFAYTPNGIIGVQGVADGNKALVTGSGSTWQVGGGLTVGDGTVTPVTGGNKNNSLVIANGGQVVVSGDVIAGLKTDGSNNRIVITNGGLLEANSLTAGAGTGNTISNVGGVYQFTTATPGITNNGFGRIALTSGTISFRGIANADVFANVNGVGNQLTNMAFAGNNTFRLNNATNTTVGSYTFNSGLGATNYQRLALTNGSRWQSTTLTIGSGGALIGSGTVASDNVTNLGTIAPGFSAGTLTFTSNLVLGASSLLQMEIGGTSLSDYDRLIVSGSVTLTGTLAVASINGFNTTPGQTFTLIDNQGPNTVFGEFMGLTNNAFIDASANGGSAYFFIQYNVGTGLNDVVLTATIPEPSTLAICVIAACVIMSRKSRRE